MRTKHLLFPATLIFCLSLAQLAPPTDASVTRRPNTAWHFVEIETTVHLAGVETSSESPEERRWYISHVGTQPEDVPTYSLIKQKIMPYFSRNEKGEAALETYQKMTTLKAFANSSPGLRFGNPGKRHLIY